MINQLSTREGRGASGLLLSAVRRAYPGLVASRTWKAGADWYLALPIGDLPPQRARRAIGYVNSTFVDDAIAQTLAAAPMLIAHAPSIGQWLQNNGFRAPDHVISCGYHPSIELRDSLPEAFTIGLAGYDTVLAGHGWQDPASTPLDGRSIKGIDRVPPIAERLPPGGVRWRLDRATGRTSLAERLRSLGHLVEVDDTTDFRRLLTGVDCLLIASRTEGGPPEALDALAAGVPVVSTPVGEMPELCDMVWSSPDEAAGWLEMIRADRQGHFERRAQLRKRVAGRSRDECAQAIARILSTLPGPALVRSMPRAGFVARRIAAPVPSAGSAAPVAPPRPPATARSAASPAPTVTRASRPAARPVARPAAQAAAPPASMARPAGRVLAPEPLGRAGADGPTRLLSVLMTAWRSQDYLAAAVESVCSQHLPDGWTSEVLIAVDACPRTLAVARALRDPRIVVVELAENGGTYRGLNTLLPMARGSLIAIMDSDDVSLPGRFAEQIGALEADAGLAYVGGQIMRADQDLSARTPFRTLPADPRAAYERGRFCFSAHGTLMVRRSLYEALGGYDDTRMGGDYDLLLRALALGAKGVNLPVQMLVRRQHPAQLTAAPGTGIGSPARTAYTDQVNQRWAAYRSGTAPRTITHPARTPVASVERPGFTGSSLVVMATVPRRTRGAIATLQDLLAQGAGRIVVYLNGHDSAAGFPASDRIEYRIRPPGTGPAVRLDVDGTDYEYVFYVDDDIDYPADYFAVTRGRLDQYGPGAAVSYHVRHWRPGASTYAQRTTIHFTDPLTVAITCGYAGLGVAAMPGRFTGLFTGPRPAMFDRNDDLWFSSVLGRAGVQIIRPPSSRGWLRGRPDMGDSIYQAARANGFHEQEKALEYLRGALGWVPTPMSVVR